MSRRTPTIDSNKVEQSASAVQAIIMYLDLHTTLTNAEKSALLRELALAIEDNPYPEGDDPNDLTEEQKQHLPRSFADRALRKKR